MSEGPKLYINKPKKTKLKRCQAQQQGKGFTLPSPSSSPSPSTASSSTPAVATQLSAEASYKKGSAPPPPPQPPKESFARRYKFLWPILLTVNLAVGAYLFTRTKKKDTSSVEEDVPSNPAATTAKIAEQTFPAIKLPSRREPIPEDQQRELFKWMLEEKRKVKPKDPEEKKLIDEEKATLKRFIQASTFPSI